VLVFLLGAIAAIVLFVVLALRPAIDQAAELVRQIPDLAASLSDRNSRLGKYVDDPEVQEQIKNFAGKIPGFLTQSVGAVFGVLGAILGGLFSAFTILALMIYFMLAMPRMRAFVSRALGDSQRVEVMDDALSKVGGYVTGQLTVSALAGIVAYIFLTIADVPYAAVLAIAVALLDAIPQVGATLGAILCSIVALTESLTLGLVTFGFFLLYQQVENYVIAPRVFARAVELSPVAVFIAVLAGGSLAGFVGALTALP
jgi:predicted PurR-regulated permease PerM